MQAVELLHHQEQEDGGEKTPVQKILQVVQEAHGAQGSEVNGIAIDVSLLLEDPLRQSSSEARPQSRCEQ